MREKPIASAECVKNEQEQWNPWNKINQKSIYD